MVWLTLSRIPLHLPPVGAFFRAPSEWIQGMVTLSEDVLKIQDTESPHIQEDRVLTSGLFSNTAPRRSSRLTKAFRMRGSNVLWKPMVKVAPL